MADREPPAIPLGFIVGAARHVAHDPETRQRLPELVLLAVLCCHRTRDPGRLLGPPVAAHP